MQVYVKAQCCDRSTTTVFNSQVRARSETGYGMFSRQTAFRTKIDRSTPPPIYYNDDEAQLGDVANQKTSTQDGAVQIQPTINKERLIVVIAVSCSVLIITISLLVFICGSKKRNTKKTFVNNEKYPGFFNRTGWSKIFVG